MSATVKSTDLAKRVMPITAELKSWKGRDREYDQAALKAAGLATEVTVAIPIFHKDDFTDLRAFEKSVARVAKEWEQTRALLVADASATVEGKTGTVYALADPTADPDHKECFLDFLFGVLVSGISLKHQAKAGIDLRDLAETKLGKPGKTATTSRGRMADKEA